MPDLSSLCDNLKAIRDGHHGLGDKIQSQIDELIAALDELLVGHYRDLFRRGLADAKTPEERLQAVERARAELLGNYEKLLRRAVELAVGGGVPVDFWPTKALELYFKLVALMRALLALRAGEREIGVVIEQWCR